MFQTATLKLSKLEKGKCKETITFLLYRERLWKSSTKTLIFFIHYRLSLSQELGNLERLFLKKLPKAFHCMVLEGSFFFTRSYILCWKHRPCCLCGDSRKRFLFNELVQFPLMWKWALFLRWYSSWFQNGKPWQSPCVHLSCTWDICG